jgi:hypothetical protein
MFIGDEKKKKILEEIWSFEFLSARDLIEEQKNNASADAKIELLDFNLLIGYSQFMQHSLKDGAECINQLHAAAMTFEFCSTQAEQINYFAGYGWSQLLLGLCLFVEGVDKKEETNKLILYCKARELWDNCRKAGIPI